jgi:hypothetical protein
LPGSYLVICGYKFAIDHLCTDLFSSEIIFSLMGSSVVLFWAVQGVECEVSCLLGRYTTAWATPPAFLDRIFCGGLYSEVQSLHTDVAILIGHHTPARNGGRGHGEDVRLVEVHCGGFF